MKRRFNIVDVVVILLIAAVIAGGAWFLATATDGFNSYVYLTVELLEQHPGFVDSVVIGDEVRDSVRNLFMGHVYAVREEPARLITFSFEQQAFVYEVIPERYDIFVTVRGRGFASPSVISLENIEVRVGQPMFLRSRGMAGHGFATELWTTERGN